MKLALRSLLALALFTPALFAVSVDFGNSGGKLTGTKAGLILSGSEFTSVSGKFGVITGDLGSVTLSTGGLTAGSLADGGLFSGGGTFILTSNGADNIHMGVLFTGSFLGPVEWTLLTLPNGSHNYTLSGVIVGTWWNGTPVNGASVQLTVNSKSFFNNKGVGISSGNTNLTGNSIKLFPTPEPASLTLLGTGMVLLAGVVRRRWSRT